MSNIESLPTTHRELITVSICMILLSTSFTIWRLVIRWKMSPWMHTSDWLMILGAMMNNAAMSTSIVCGFNGAGRLLRDPFWQPNAVDKMVYQNHLIFASQLLNVYGMWVVKMSICAFLLALNFSMGYRRVIWGTIVFATIFNFLLPVVQHFGLCRPLASRWDFRITDKTCWSQKVRIGIAYTQAISNIVTDLVYATAPLAYIRCVRISKRTQWSVRAVFLMSLVCTTISAIKLWVFQQLQGQKEFYYKSVSLSIWSMTEVSVGIVVANLPPLRKSFDRLLRSVFPTSLLNTIDEMRFKNLHLSTYYSRNATKGRPSEVIESSSSVVLAMFDRSEETILRDINTAESQNGDSAIFTSHVRTNSNTGRNSNN